MLIILFCVVILAVVWFVFKDAGEKPKSSNLAEPGSKVNGRTTESDVT